MHIDNFILNSVPVKLLFYSSDNVNSVGRYVKINQAVWAVRGKTEVDIRTYYTSTRKTHLQ